MNKFLIKNKNEFNFKFYELTILLILLPENQLPQEIVAPRTIQEVPDKLLSSGIYLPGRFFFTIYSIQTLNLFIIQLAFQVNYKTTSIFTTRFNKQNIITTCIYIWYLSLSLSICI